MNEPPVKSDWQGRWLIGWVRFWSGRRWAFAEILIVLGVGCSWLSKGVVWESDVLQFFSADSAEVRNMHAAQARPGLANQLRLDVHRARDSEHPDAGDADSAVTTAAREMAMLLQKTGEFRTVWLGVSAAESATRMQELIAHGPELLDQTEPASVEAHASADYLFERFAQVRDRLADPDGEILLRQLAADPLNLAQTLGVRMQQLAPGKKGGAAQEDANAEGGSPTLSNGLLMARDSDGRAHVMIVTEPWALPSDQRGAARMLAAVNEAIAEIRAKHAVGVWVVGAHRAYVENERQVVSDVTFVGVLGTLAVGLAIALYFRSLWPALLCMIPPAVGVGLAMGLAGGAGVSLPLILLGFVGLLCGSTTDYGILLIAECRKLADQEGRDWNADLPARAARRLLGPISMSVATSATGFAALGLSASPGLRALGLFVAAATLCIWAVTFLVLPVFLGRWAATEFRTGNAKLQIPRWVKWGGLAVFAGATMWLGWYALHVRFDFNPRALDGSSAELRAEEDAFSKVWGDVRNQAVVLVGGPTADAALTTLNRVNDYLQDQLHDGLIAAVISPAAILPDQLTAEARARKWADYWTDTRRTELRKSLMDAAQANGFSVTSMGAYADRIVPAVTPSAAQRVSTSPASLLPGFIDTQKDGALTVATIVQMRPTTSSESGAVSMRMATGWGPELRTRFPDVVVLSGNLLAFDATERSRAEAERLAPLCVLAILLPLWIYLRRFGRAWLAMICLGVGLLWVAGAAAAFGGGLNLLALVPVLFTLGVTVDYGIYAVTDPAYARGAAPAAPRESGRGGAAFLCAATTILGTAPLIFAHHPAMRWLGLTLVAGIGGGYLTSHLVVRPIMQHISKERDRNAGIFHKAWRSAVGVMTWSGAVILTFALLTPPVVQWVLSRESPMPANAARPHPEVIQTGPRTYVAGDSWMRWRTTGQGIDNVSHEDGNKSGMWELLLAGDAQDRGYAAAKMAGPIDVRIENEMLEQLETFLPQEWSRWLIVQGMQANLVNLPAHVPQEYQQEIYWDAMFHRDVHDYLGPMYPRVLGYHALHDVSQMLIDNPLLATSTFACTGVVSLPAYSAGAGGGRRGDGHLYMARVFDFEAGESFGRQKSITYVVPAEKGGIPFAHVAWPGLAGVVTGMNREKIALFINAAATEDWKRIGTPTILMARDILQHAHSLAEAEVIIRATQVFVSDIVVVADGKTGSARVFEKSPGRLGVYDVNRSAVVTNHLVTEVFKQDSVNRSRMIEGTTVDRNARARQLLDRIAGHVTPEDLARLLRDKKGVGDRNLGLGNRNAIDGLIACHAVIMDVTTGEMWVAAWPYAEGEFMGVNVPAMLDHASGNAVAEYPASPARIDPDAIMHQDWPRFLASREAAKNGAAALDAGQYDKALEFADEELRDNPGFYQGYELRGRALLKRGDKQGAKAAFEEALNLDPPYAARRLTIEGLIRQCEK